MVRSEITVNELSGAFADAETPDDIDISNGHKIVAGKNFERMVLAFHISTGTGTGAKITIKAGTAEPAFRRDLGDLVRADDVVADDEILLGPIETARYMQADGSIHVDFTDTTNTDLAGTIDVYALP
ncbi:MAG: hypothetical protein ACXQT2_01430 [Methanotrichaceae archaeon]